MNYNIRHLRPSINDGWLLVQGTSRMQHSGGEITRLLGRFGHGDAEAMNELLPLVYEELRRIASAYLASERAGHTLQPTALVHEAYLKLAGAEDLELRERGHFFAVAARAMRRILVDHARSQIAEKRVGAHRKVPLDGHDVLDDDKPEHVVTVHDALEILAVEHPRPARIVELRFFGGLSEEEIAQALDVSLSTVTRDWRFARLWLYHQLEPRRQNGAGRES